MKLPNAENAIIDSEKLTGYCLNPEYPDGQHKAIVFKSALGLYQFYVCLHRSLNPL